MTLTVQGKNRTRPGSILLSAAVHSAVVAAVLLALRAEKTHPIAMESRCCSSALYWSAHTGAGSPRPIRAPHHQHPIPAPARAAEPAVPAAPVSAVQTAQAQVGMDSQQQPATLGTGTGTDNAEPALPVYNPQPGVPDRALLPAGRKNVIVEVEIDALGDVTDERLVSGLGNALDQIVLDTVKAWRFRPATLNGTAVASVEDVVIPFNHDWQPSSG